MSHTTEAILILIAMAVLLFLLWLAPASADHLDWMQQYRTPIGGDCCKDRNCVPVSAAVLNLAEGEVMVEGQVIKVEPKRLHRIPEHIPGLHGFWCYQVRPPIAAQFDVEDLLCLFYRTGLN